MYMTGAPAMTDGAPTKIEAIGLYDLRLHFVFRRCL